MRRLDAVSIFNDKLSFLVPHEWGESYSEDDGTYLYCTEDATSGWFRVSLLSAHGEGDAWKQLEKQFAEYAEVRINDRTRNLIARWERDSVEDGESIRIYYWKVGGIVELGTIRTAIFSFTARHGLADTPEVQEEIMLLDKLISRAEFGPYRPSEP